MLKLKDVSFWLFIAIMAFCATARSQTTSKDVVASVNVYLDDKKVETDKILVTLAKSDSYVRINDSFVTYLHPDKTYSMTITHPEYNIGIIKIDTSKRGSKIDIKVYLSSKDTTRYYTYYRYDNSIKNYKQIRL